MEQKKCLKCLQEKPINHFYTTKSGGRINECSACKTLYHKEYRERNRANIQEITRRSKAKKWELEKAIKKEKREKELTIKKCAKRHCTEPAVQYEDVSKFCKCHAIDYIFQINV